MDNKKKENPTRGEGLLEYYLTKKRIRMANSLIPETLRQGNILDIGCGAYPYFLLSSGFNKKYGAERKINGQPDGLYLEEYDIASPEQLPFSVVYFNAITLLAVIEHISTETAADLFKKIYKRLKPGSVLIITTPTRAADIILRAMAKLKLVSKIEMKEHVQKYTPTILKTRLIAGGFKEKNITIGRFELGLNLYARAVK